MRPTTRDLSIIDPARSVPAGQAVTARIGRTGQITAARTRRSDRLFRMPTLHLARAHAAGGGRTYIYDLTLAPDPLGVPLSSAT